MEGCVLTVRCCSSGLVNSTSRLTGRRRDVGVGDSDGSRVHTWTKRRGDVSMRHDKNMRKHRSERGRSAVEADDVGKPGACRIRQAWQ